MPDILSLVQNVEHVLVREGAALWGFADLSGLVGPELEPCAHAVSFALAMDPRIMATVVSGPNHPYAEEYARVNEELNRISGLLTQALGNAGYHAQAIAASDRTDPINIRGDFPHKTAATRAGLGWVGRNAQLITRQLGPWLRLSTVLTDAPLPTTRKPVEKSFCGRCTVCVESCPAHALVGEAWVPGISRDALLDAGACDRWKKRYYFEFHEGHNCGICTAVCPFGQKQIRRTSPPA